MKIKRTWIFALALSLTFPALHAQEKVALSTLDLSQSYQDYGNVTKDRAVTGESLKVAGKSYTTGVGVLAGSRMKVSLRKKAQRFTCKVGVNDQSIDYKAADVMQIPMTDGTMVFYKPDGDRKRFIGIGSGNGTIGKGSVVFRVIGDGKELFNSGVMHSGDTPKDIDLSLTDVATLELETVDGGDGYSGDHADWIDATIGYTGEQPVMVSPDYQGEARAMDQTAAKKIQQKMATLSPLALPVAKVHFDWLIHPEQVKAGVYVSENRREILISNGLVTRRFRIFPNLATIDIINQMTDESMMRAVSSEGSLSIDGKQWNLGGLTGQPELGYLKETWIEQMTPLPHSFFVEDFEIGAIEEQLHWKSTRWALNKEMPTGKRLTFTLRGTDEQAQTVVKLHYDIYDRLPVIRKSMEILNESPVPFNLDSFKLEYLSFTEPESTDGDGTNMLRPNIHVESNYAFDSFWEVGSDHTEHWVKDKNYTSQCSYDLNTRCILDVSLPIGPDVAVTQKEPFRSNEVYEMPFDSYDRERKGLFQRRMHSTVAPWTTENPIFLHLTSSDPTVVRNAVDQCAATGYEMIILSFGSGLNMEDESAENYSKYKALVDYARSKGIQMGSYSLLASRWISDEVDVINPATGKRGGMRFGSSPCLCSEWGYEYFRKVRTFFEKTGMTVFENDGSYPGDVCASTTHAHHKGLNDSQWLQWKQITGLYAWMNSKGIYMNVPDFYFLAGTNKTGIGYRETNWSLPRERQLIHGRQVNYRGTFDRTGSSCWTFVPLTQYHGGGAAATIEPLDEHLSTYKAHMIQNYGAGVQACYRGPRLYDTDRTKAMVTEVIGWYKKYRDILNSDIIHIRCADAKDWDGFIHVNPALREKGLAMLFNPLDTPITRTISLPLYYTGLTDAALISDGEGEAKSYKLNRDYTVDLTVTIPANGYKWILVK